VPKIQTSRRRILPPQAPIKRELIDVHWKYGWGLFEKVDLSTNCAYDFLRSWGGVCCVMGTKWMAKRQLVSIVHIGVLCIFMKFYY
jgi:hypothetical protein